jgi:hypothetical protein
VIGSAATGDVTGGERTGGLVGYSLVGDVVDAAARGDVTGGERTGGLVGNLEGSVLVGAAATGNVTGDADVGGLVGLGFISTMSNSYARGAVDGSTRVGGLVGHHSGGPLYVTYATGLVAKSDGGGLVGRMAADHPVVDSYWDRETTTRLGSSGGGTRLDTARMTGVGPREHLRGFDVPADWYLTDSYPVLAWEDAGPFFTVTVAETTASVTAEATLAVAVNVTNHGARGTQSVTLTDTDFTGSRQDAVRVRLDPDESVSVTLSWTPRRADGGVTGRISVDSTNDAAALTATVAEATTPSPTPTPEPTTTTQPPTRDPSTPTETTGADGPGFGVPLAVLAVGLTVLLGLRLGT